ncbi:hypothetical protein SSPO_005830 [Streptomyces antimycoticus]|uniref:Uncharacterized protein n=1 Tax=Streptomyces antimycoticus TaxID=68175 RepID=A0A499UAP9_9ACTN|nr:hypothetical protein SSPO_005830 [Streptomyces antimycoticus]
MPAPPLPAACRQGLAAAVTAALPTHAREHGVRTVFLAYAEDSVARIYARALNTEDTLKATQDEA